MHASDLRVNYRSLRSPFKPLRGSSARKLAAALRVTAPSATRADRHQVGGGGVADGSNGSRHHSFREFCTAKIEQRRPLDWPDPILYRLRALLPICRPATAGISGTTGTTIVT